MKKFDIIQEIILDLASIQGMSASELIKGDDFGLPRLISAGNGENIQITKKIDDNISYLARVLKDERPQLLKSVRNEEWRGWLRLIIGPALMRVDLSDPIEHSVNKISFCLNEEISDFISSLGKSEYSFGISFLNIAKLDPFAIGPVRFEAREDWLNRKLSEEFITPVMHRRIMRSWRGAKMRSRKNIRDNIDENDIISTIGGSHFVCSVAVDGLSGEAGREIALSAARLGLACISLLWNQSSKALSGMNLRGDVGMRREQILRFVPGRVTLQGSRIHGRSDGPSIGVAEWYQAVKENADLFSAAGEVLEYLVSSDNNVPRSRLMNIIMQSLLWFYEGCKEENDLLAIVDFSASLDALGGGMDKYGIISVLEARVGAKGNNQVYKGGPTLKRLIDIIYSDGRSRAIHGTSEKFGHDWNRTRNHAEFLAKICLRASLEWAGSNPEAEDPALLKK